MTHSSEPWPSVSITVPTYKEVRNVPLLVERLKKVRDDHRMEMEVVIVDDNSRDGTTEAVAAMGLPWVRLIVRENERGLSSAVIRGLHESRHEIALVMDADLSHPPEKVPELVRAIQGGNDFVIGSRYVKGGSTDAEWGVFRWLNSKVATLMARPFTSAKDPMAGFFAFRRAALDSAAPLNPVGYKIGLELIVKCRFKRVGEVPIHFEDRKHGESKLNFKEQLRYVQHLGRLMKFKLFGAKRSA